MRRAILSNRGFITGLAVFVLIVGGSLLITLVGRGRIARFKVQG